MVSEDEAGLEGHDSGGVKIAARTKGVFCFADGTIVLTNEAVRDIAAVSEATEDGSPGGTQWRFAQRPLPGVLAIRRRDKDEQRRAEYER